MTMATLDNERLGLVFATRPDILEGIQNAAGMYMYMFMCSALSLLILMLLLLLLLNIRN